MRCNSQGRRQSHKLLVISTPTRESERKKTRIWAWAVQDLTSHAFKTSFLLFRGSFVQNCFSKRTLQSILKQNQCKKRRRRPNFNACQCFWRTSHGLVRPGVVASDHDAAKLHYFVLNNRWEQFQRRPPLVSLRQCNYQKVNRRHVTWNSHASLSFFVSQSMCIALVSKLTIMIMMPKEVISWKRVSNYMEMLSPTSLDSK